MRLETSIEGLRRSTEILMCMQDMPLYEYVEIDLKIQITVFKLAIHYEAYAFGNRHPGDEEIYLDNRVCDEFY